MDKTKVMLMSREAKEINIKIEDTKLEQISQFQYLGSTLTSDNNSKPEIYRRCNLASAAFGKLAKIWRDKNINQHTKWRLFNALVLPVAMYGCETWTINQACMKKLAAFEMICIRKVLNIKWQDKITNEEVIRKANLPSNWLSICAKIKQRQAQWYGHVLRMEETRMPKQALLEASIKRPNQKQRVGNPGTKWEKSILKQMNIANREEANIIANDRENWRNVIQIGANVR